MKTTPKDHAGQGLPGGAPVLPPPGGDIYLMGICGTGMTALAGLLTERGYRVRGSDNGAYPPMSLLLERLAIPFVLGYDPANLTPAPDLVIIGNVIRADNPEAREALARGLPYMSFPQAVSSLCLGERYSLVVAGTHGKTTTATLLVSALEEAGAPPGFMIGGVVLGHGSGFRLGSPPWFVIEGDEYDTAFFDKSPKFLHYRPRGVILTSIEFDHADIYPDLDAVKDAFSRLVALVPPDGVLVACADWPAVRDVCAGARCPVVTYGTCPGADWGLGAWTSEPSGIRFEVLRKGLRSGQARARLPGRHNALNALSVLALTSHLGLDEQAVLAGVAACAGVKRRQEVRGEEGGVTLIDDFAHHPTAVRETLDALRARYPGRRLVAVFEPRTNTSRRRIFQEMYAGSFGAADRVLVRAVPDPEKAPLGDRFSSEQLVEDLRALGKDAAYFLDATAILADLVSGKTRGDVVVILSNGAFEGLHDRFLAALREGDA